MREWISLIEMRLRTRFSVLVSFLAFAAICPAQVRLSGPFHLLSHGELEVLTNSSESEGKALLHSLVQASTYFHQIGLYGEGHSAAVKIFSFQTRTEYEQLGVTRGAFGQYIHGLRGDFIVLRDIQPQHREAAIHELTHAVLRRAGLNLPIWLNEGLADVYSSLTEQHGEIMVGAPLPARMQFLKTRAWLDLGALLEMRNEQALFERGQQVGTFYAQSWALTHMLLLSAKFASRFPELLQVLGSGVSSGQALVQIYGQDLNALSADLHRYVEEKELQAIRASRRLETTAGTELQTATLDTFESSLELANLLAAMPSTAPQAEVLLAGLRQQAADDPEILGRADGTDREGRLISELLEQ